jgi:hypothetical protein
MIESNEAVRALLRRIEAEYGMRDGAAAGDVADGEWRAIDRSIVRRKAMPDSSASRVYRR